MRRWMLMLVLILVSCGGQQVESTTVAEPPSTAVAPTAEASEPTAATASLDQPENVLAFLEQRKDSVALVSYSVAKDGSIVEDDPQIMHHAEQPMTLASTIKIVVLAAYALDVHEGRLDPQQMIPIEQWEAFYLPGTDGEAHRQSLEALGLAADGVGFAEDPTQEVALDAVVQAMIESSDNAATDLLLTLIDPATLDQVLALPQLQHQERPTSLLGLFLLLGHHEQPTFDQQYLDSLMALAPAERQQMIDQLAQKYTQTEWGQAEREWRTSSVALPSYELQQAFVQQLSPKGAAQDYAGVMAGVYTETFIAPEVSQIMREKLEWPMRMAGNKQVFEAFGAKGGTLPGVITEAMFITPQESAWNGVTRVVVLFQEDLALQPWAEFLSTFGFQNFEVKLGLDPAFATKVEEAFAR